MAAKRITISMNATEARYVEDYVRDGGPQCRAVAQRIRETAPGLSVAEHRLVEAIRLTVEYVGLATLRPLDGWSWFDAWKAIDPDGLQNWLGEMAHSGRPTIGVDATTGPGSPSPEV